MQGAPRAVRGRPNSLLLGLMTAAFAIGQLAGPVVSGTLDLLPIGHSIALGHALQLAAFALALSAAWLWRHSHRVPRAMEEPSMACRLTDARRLTSTVGIDTRDLRESQNKGE